MRETRLCQKAQTNLPERDWLAPGEGASAGRRLIIGLFGNAEFRIRAAAGLAGRLRLRVDIVTLAQIFLTSGIIHWSISLCRHCADEMLTTFTKW